MERPVAQVLVRNLDAAVVERLKARAKAKGRSLQDELHDIVSRAAEPASDEDDLVGFFDRLRKANPINTTPLAAAEIREGLERPSGSSWTRASASNGSSRRRAAPRRDICCAAR
jgi:plasmid stability protein